MDTRSDISLFELGDSELFVIRRCPECQRFVTCGQVLINGLGDIKLEGWICSRHEEVQPEEWGWLE